MDQSTGDQQEPYNVTEEECLSEQVENTYWRVALFYIKAYFKCQLLQIVCVRADLPNVNLFLGWACSSYVKVENPVEAEFCRKIEVIVTLLEKGGAIEQGFSKFFVVRPRFEKDIYTRPHYGHIHVNDIKTLPSTANCMGNVCLLRRVASGS